MSGKNGRHTAYVESETPVHLPRGRDRDYATGRLTLMPPHENAHWLVKFLHLQMMTVGMTRAELSDKSGIPERTLKEWWRARRGYVPRISMLEDALQTLGFRLKPSWIEPPDDSSDTAR